MKILFASSEAHPLIKTGGLADVAGSLPRAVLNQRQDIRLVIPAYRVVLQQADNLQLAAHLELAGVSDPVRILSGRLPGSNVRLYLVDSPRHFDRAGNPYTRDDGTEWPDNAERFTVFCRAIHAIATNASGLNWQPDIVHCNECQRTRLAARYRPLQRLADRPGAGHAERKHGGAGFHIHHPQPGLPGTVRLQDLQGTGTADELVVHGGHGVP